MRPKGTAGSRPGRLDAPVAVRFMRWCSASRRLKRRGDAQRLELGAKARVPLFSELAGLVVQGAAPLDPCRGRGRLLPS